MSESISKPGRRGVHVRVLMKGHRPSREKQARGAAGGGGGHPETAQALAGQGDRARQGPRR